MADNVESSNVLDEVEALFKKLQDLPDTIRQKALDCIQEKLPGIEHSPAKVKKAEIIGNPPCASFEKTVESAKITAQSKRNDSNETASTSQTVSTASKDSDLVLEDIQTSRGRKTKRINVASFARQSKRANKLPETLRDAKEKSGSSPPKIAEESAAKTSVIKVKGRKSKKDTTAKGKKDCLRDKTNNVEWDTESDSVKSVEAASATQTANLTDDEGIPDVVCDLEEIEDDNAVPTVKQEILDCEDTYDPNDDDVDDPTWKGDNAANDLGEEPAVHTRKHKENIPKRPHVCTECRKIFTQAGSLQLHMKRHRGERDFACANCDYKAFTKVDLTRHMTIHTGERDRICEYCGKAFAKDSTLRDHVRAVHERKREHSCELCGFITHRANNLRVHIRMRHHGEYNNHVCPVCKASVKQKNAFLEHMRSHTGERPYKCDKCDASFACTARLNVHKNSVHGDRQFKCDDCSKSFQTKHHLLRHQAIHTKERPYACPYCSYACNTQGNIAKHVRAIHNQPDFSYRKYKDLLQNGGQRKDIDPEWVKKGEEVTKEYLQELSEKLGKPVTLDELWTKELELKKKKEEMEKLRLIMRERKSKSSAQSDVCDTKPKRRKCDIRKGHPKIIESYVDRDTQDEDDDGTLYGLLSRSGNIQLCLETNEVQVYTGDATRELSLLQMRDGANIALDEHVQTIQGYVNEEGRFVRCEEGIEINEDDSTVVVIINSTDDDDPSSLVFGSPSPPPVVSKCSQAESTEHEAQHGRIMSVKDIEEINSVTRVSINVNDSIATDGPKLTVSKHLGNQSSNFV